MFRMSHPEHGFQMVQPADKPMFDRAGWSVVIPVEPEMQPEPEQEPEPEQPRKRGRPRKVVTSDDGL